MFRQTTRIVRTALRRRNMSGSTHDEHVKEVKNWKKYSMGMIGLSFIFTVVNVGIIKSNGHHEPTPNVLPYMKNRVKEFPWTCSDCALFDAHCWEECKAEKAAEAAEAAEAEAEAEAEDEEDN